MNSKEHLKPQVIELYRQYKTVGQVCDKAGITARTFRKWKQADPDFAQAIDLVEEVRTDFVENALMQRIKDGDTTAIIFYLKTRGKTRGYTERPQTEPQPQAVQLPAVVSIEPTAKQINAKSAYIKRVLKKLGKYSDDLTFQVTIAAQLIVRADALAREIFSEGYNPVRVEKSREGNDRVIVNPKEKLFLDYAGRAQQALRALGANTDSRQQLTQEDGLASWLAEFKTDDDE